MSQIQNNPPQTSLMSNQNSGRETPISPPSEIPIDQSNFIQSQCSNLLMSQNQPEAKAEETEMNPERVKSPEIEEYNTP